MENKIVAESCRVCLRKTKKLGSLYETSDEGDQPLNKMLHLITGVIIEEMNEYEHLPKSLCKKCELSLNKAFIFRENALKTQQILEAYVKELNENYGFEENNPSVVMVKSEFEDINFEPMDSVEPIKEEFQYLSNDQSKYSVENGELNEVIQSENICKETHQINDDVCNQQKTAFFDHKSKKNHENINVKKENTEDGYTRTMSDEDDFDYTEETEFFDHKSKKNHENINVKKENTEDGYTHTKSDEDDFNYTEENFEIMPTDGENYAVIQINLTKAKSIRSIKKNSRHGRMIEQRKRLDKACRLVCEKCEKKFLTFKLLRKHMSSHCGDKQFKCQFCSRTFPTKGKQKRHEIVHGPREYICDVCNKGFNYSHHLKRHKLTHDEIKDYRCEYCDKDFRLKHHKQKHDLTKSHHNTVRIAKLCKLSFLNSGQMKNQETLNENILFKKEIADDRSTGER